MCEKRPVRDTTDSCLSEQALLYTPYELRIISETKETFKRLKRDQ